MIMMALMAGQAVSGIIGGIRAQDSADSSYRNQKKFLENQLKINSITADINKSYIDLEAEKVKSVQMDYMERNSKIIEGKYAYNVNALANSSVDKDSSVYGSVITSSSEDAFVNEAMQEKNYENLARDTYMKKIGVDIDKYKQDMSVTSQSMSAANQYQAQTDAATNMIVGSAIQGAISMYGSYKGSSSNSGSSISSPTSSNALQLESFGDLEKTGNSFSDSWKGSSNNFGSMDLSKGSSFL